MKKINYILFLLLGFGFIACQSSEPEASAKQGSLALIMDSRGGIDIPVVPIMKSEAAPTVDVDTFHVVIRNEAGLQIAQNFDTFEELLQVGMPLLLPIGKYTAEASSGILPDAAFGIPCYRGSKDFIIEENTVSEVKLHCTPQSLKVTLKYTDNFHAQIKSDYKIIVANGLGGTLVFTKEEIRSGYFIVQEPISLHIEGISKEFGTRVDFAADLKHIDVSGDEHPLEMGDHLIVTLDAEKVTLTPTPSIKSIELR